MDNLDKKYYPISEVAELTGLPVSTLRFWESEFSELRPKRTPKGHRLYTPRDIETVRMLHYLIKERGLKLEAAKTELRNNRRGVEKHHDVVRRLQDIRARLQNILNALDR